MESHQSSVLGSAAGAAGMEPSLFFLVAGGAKADDNE
jgi:hypothetical protein